MESTSYVFSFRMVFFYLVDTGWVLISAYCVSVLCVVSSHLFWTSDLWTHQLGSHRRKVTQGEGHTGILRLPSAVFALIFVARRIQLSLSLVDRDVESCVVVVVFTLKAVPISTQYFLTSVLVQLTPMPSVVTG